MSVIPFICVVSRAKEIRFLLLEQHVEALVEVPDVVLTGRGNDDIGLGDIQSVQSVVDVVWEGSSEREGLEELGHAPTRVCEEKAQFDVGLGAEGVN